MKRVIVVGAGAAGLMAAVIAAQKGAQVLLLEKMNMVGKKMGITGKGRCNITNNCPMEDFIKKTPGNGKFLFSAYQTFTNEDLLSLVNSWGLKTKVERGGRVFPMSDSALEVRNLFMQKLKEYGAKLHLNEAVKHIQVENQRVVGIVTDKETYKCDAVILCTGGMSYPLTGSTGDGYKIAKEIGHNITDIRPSLIPLETEETWPKTIMGLSLKNVELSVIRKGKVEAKNFGEMMFTHFGITGPIVLSLSNTVTKLALKKKDPLYLDINLKPALSEDALDKRIQKDFTKYLNKQLGNGLVDLLPSRLIPIIIKEAGLEENQVINSITKQERHSLVHCLQHLHLTFKSARPISEAIVTAGGINVKEFNPKSMESKFIKNLYAAGEVLDIDAYTGGYNLQAAFSTGYTAAIHSIEEEG